MSNFVELLKSYQKKLTNLTGNNRSLLLLKLYKDSFLDFKKLDFSYNQRPLHDLFELLILRKKSIPICSINDSRDEISNSLSNLISIIARKNKFIFEENGSKNLKFGFPIIEGKLNDGTIIRTPLIFFPVEFEISTIKSKPTWTITINDDEFPAFNKTFLLAYSFFNKINLDNKIYDFSFEENFEDALSFKNFLYQFLKNSNIDINFNTELFSNKFDFFLDTTKDIKEKELKNGELKLLPQAVFGIFPENNSAIELDYEFLITNNNFNNLNDYFQSKIQTNKTIKEENQFTIFDIDASQEHTLKEIKSGKSLVVQGPPGTGKSQLICNLITDFLANNKKVLVVCQKKVALDVVYNRLNINQLNNFIGLVHDFKFDKKNIFNQISNQIENIEDYKNENNSLDTIWLEKEFLQTSRQIEKICLELDNFKIALFDDSMFGISIKNLYLLANIETSYNKDFITFYNSLNVNSLFVLNNKFSKLLPYSSIIENENFQFKNRVSFAKYQPTDSILMKELIQEIYDNSISFNFENDYFSEKITFNSLLKSDFIDSKLNELEIFLENETIFNISNHLFCTNYDQKNILKDIISYEKLLSKSDFDSSNLNNELAFTIEIFENCLLEIKTLLGNLKWKYFHKHRYIISNLLDKYGLKINPKNVSEMIFKLKNRLILKNKYSKICLFLNIKNNSEILNIQDFLVFKNLVIKCFDCVAILIDLKIDFNLKIKSFELVIFKKTIVDFNIFYKKYKKNIEKYLYKFTKHNITLIASNQEFKLEFFKEIDLYFEHLVSYDQLLSELSQIEKNVFSYFLKTNNIESVLINFNNEVYNSWIEKIEFKYQILTSCSNLSLESNEIELQNLIKNKQKLTTQIVLLKLKENTYKNILYNRLNNRITFKDLQHQTSKKRNLWSLRKLFEIFEQDILKLLPCWLASPETVSAIFPQNELFDLVIFDEASQCFAEKGFAATIRAKQICVVGDDKQLAPNDLYKPRFEEENENLDIEIDSLLNLTEKFFPQTMLSSHFRSKQYDLIKFSNENFYKNKLSFIPDFIDYNTQNLPIKYINVKGFWENNTNNIEALEVVELVINYLKNKLNKSIGIITFNIKQKLLIEEILYQKFIELEISVPNDLFVKNLENVQGDERDIIIFSIGYAPSRIGKMMMQFGSLNLINGENRLNVALTRAKERIYIVTSIFPNQLEVENSVNLGPKLLKKYLEFAFNLSNMLYINIQIEPLNSSKYLSSKLNILNSKILQFNDRFADAIIDKTLILTDDDLYFKSISSKDYFGYNPLYLKNKNWTYKRFFSRNFWLKNIVI